MLWVCYVEPECPVVDFLSYGATSKQGDVQQHLPAHLRHLEILSPFICIKKNQNTCPFPSPSSLWSGVKLLAEVVARITRWKKMASHLKTPTSNDSLPQ
ncbi:hypothetical protein CEXT_436791 [Caerostris extrusa]|uniref:Uncharacterized protein n=1 Tax=Caerostris extrusa TaxID=172846 RepID=A0AAV4TAM0_CAEEX|nr:hypothetical protein CEXT_436791 [Caerostris extrusa]